jgi:hypothetical protein
MDLSLLGIAAAFGLASSAGLNTTLPLLAVGLLARGGMMHLTAPYDALMSPVALAGLGLLAAIELIGDKIPVIDTTVHVLQWPLAATAGAILFASQTSTITWVHPGLAIVVGVLTAGGVHGVRAAIRPLVTMATGGLGNIVVSLGEDVASVGVAAVAVLAPVLVVVPLALLIFVAVQFIRRRTRGRAASASVPPTVSPAL